MKRVILALVLSSAIGFAQNRLATAPATLFKSYAPFTATSDDTTGFYTVSVVSPLDATEVYLVGIATDSVAADVYVIGRNSVLTSVTTTYADSIVGTSNTSNIAIITVKSSTVNRFPGEDQFKIGTVFRAAGNGTTAGRTMKWYVYWKY